MEDIEVWLEANWNKRFLILDTKTIYFYDLEETFQGFRAIKEAFPQYSFNQHNRLIKVFYEKNS